MRRIFPIGVVLAVVVGSWSLATGTAFAAGGSVAFDVSSTTIANAAVGEQITLTLHRTGGSGVASVDMVYDGSSTADSGDYSVVSGGAVSVSGGVATVSFTAGDQDQDVTVDMVANTGSASPPLLTLDLTNAVNTGIAGADNTSAITINDTPGLTVQASPATTTQGSPANFNVTLTGVHAEDVTVHCTTADGTATAPADYTGLNGACATFHETSSTTPVVVPVAVDTTSLGSYNMNDTTFSLTIAVSSGAATISGTNPVDMSIHDATVETVSIANPSPFVEPYPHGAPDTDNFVLTLSPKPVAAGQSITVDFATADGTAVAPTNYTAVPSTPITFTSGTGTTIDEPVTIKADGVHGPASESFTASISNPTGGAVLGQSNATAVITDSPSFLTVTVDPPVVEPISGTRTLNAHVTLSVLPGAGPVVVTFHTANGTAIAGVNYVARSGTLTFHSAGTQNVLLTVMNDHVAESTNGTFSVIITSPDADIAVGSATATIYDESTVPTVTVSGERATCSGSSGCVLALPEGTAPLPGASFRFDVRLNKPPSHGAITVRWSVGAPGGNLIPAPSSEYKISSSLSLTFANNTTQLVQTVTVTADPNAIDQPNFYFAAILASSATGIYNVGSPGRALGEILNDDSTGYWLLGINGSVTTLGTATASFFRSLPTDSIFMSPGLIASSMVPTPDRRGYWILGTDGGVFAFGDAGYMGNALGFFPRAAQGGARAIGIAATPSGRGYWIAGSDGSVFSYGDARFYGSLGNFRIDPNSCDAITGIAATPGGGGYRLVSRRGGVFDFGNANYAGSLNFPNCDSPILSITSSPTGFGYWLFSTNGGVFSFGSDAGFFGSGNYAYNTDHIVFVGMAASPDGRGYTLFDTKGNMFFFGNPTIVLPPLTSPTKLISSITSS